MTNGLVLDASSGYVPAPEALEMLNKSALQSLCDQNMFRPATPDLLADAYTDSCSESASEPADVVSDKQRPGRRGAIPKRRRTTERGPRLTVLSVQGSVVEYQLETMKQKTVTFKFDRTDTVPADVASNLILHNFLSEQHSEIFIEQVL